MVESGLGMLTCCDFKDCYSFTFNKTFEAEKEKGGKRFIFW